MSDATAQALAVAMQGLQGSLDVFNAGITSFSWFYLGCVLGVVFIAGLKVGMS